MTGDGPARLGWRAVHDEALRRIAARDWAPGDLIPTEAALAEELGCARATVNRALRELAESGVIERRRKAGSRVALRPTRHARIAIPLIREEIEETGARYDYRLDLREEAAPPPGASLSGRALHVEATHLADGAPHVFEDRWISLDIAPEAADVDFAEISANEWLVRHAPFSGGDVCLTSLPAEAREAEALSVAAGAALFVVERVTRAPDGPVTAVRLAYAPGYAMRLSL